MMTRWGITTLLLLALCPSVADAAVSFFWRAEGTTLSATDDYNPNNSTETASTYGSPAINGTAALVGSNGLDFSTGNEGYNFTTAASNFNMAAGTIAFYLRITTFGHDYELVKIVTDGTNEFCRLSFSTTTNNHIQLAFRESGAGWQTFESTTALSTGTTYFVIVSWDQSASDRRIEIYDSGGTLVGANENTSTGWTSPSTAGLPLANGLKIGDTSANSATIYMDNFFIFNTYANKQEAYDNRNITSYSAYGGAAPVNFFSRRLQVNP